MTLVTASVRPSSAIRKEIHPVKRTQVISSGFSGKIEADKPARIFSFTSDGEDEVDLIIEGTKTFDLSDPVDRHNWDVLNVFCKINPYSAKSLSLYNPQEAVEAQIAKDREIFEVEKFLRDSEADEVLLGKLYRRVIGSGSGLSAKQIFNKLILTAKETPDKFMNGGKIVSDTQSFELMALLDIAIEKGIILKDTDGKIKKDRDTIYAKSQEDAAFQLKDDVDFRVYLQRGIDPKATGPQQPYEPKFEDSDFVKLASSLGKEVGTAVLDGKSSMDDEDTIKLSIEDFKEAGLIQSEGKGFQMKYLMPNFSAEKYTKKDLIAFFQKNQPVYDQFKESVLIK